MNRWYQARGQRAVTVITVIVTGVGTFYNPLCHVVMTK